MVFLSAAAQSITEYVLQVMVDGAGAAVHSPVLPAGINVVEDQAGSSVAISFRPLPRVICHYVGYHNTPTFNFLLHFISDETFPLSLSLSFSFSLVHCLWPIYIKPRKTDGSRSSVPDRPESADSLSAQRSSEALPNMPRVTPRERLRGITDLGSVCLSCANNGFIDRQGL